MNDNYGSVMKLIALVLFALTFICAIFIMVHFTFSAGLTVLVSAFVSCILIYGVGQIVENTASTSAYTEMTQNPLRRRGTGCAKHVVWGIQNILRRVSTVGN